MRTRPALRPSTAHLARRAPLLALACALTGLLGCSQLMEFDRGKIKPSRDGGARLSDGGPDGSIRDASLDDAMAASDGGASCNGDGDCALSSRSQCVTHVCEVCDPQDHAGCANDQLCCPSSGKNACVPTSLAACEGCGMACNSDSQEAVADACVGRTCRCGTSDACDLAGAAVQCLDPDGAGGAGARCLECRTYTDCVGHAGGPECANGDCAECDPGASPTDTADDRGCSGNAPICDATSFECEPCTKNPDNCPTPMACENNGACTGCTPGTNAGCGGTKPLCLETSASSGKYTCKSCSSDLSCGSGKQCLSSGECATCDPADNAGCSGGTPFCSLTLGVYACRACTPSDCGGTTSLCATTGPNAGHCVGCTTDTQCGSADKPLCRLNACSACTTVASADNANDRCDALTTGFLCVRSGAQAGYCGPCDPSTHGGCLDDEMCCYNGTTPECQVTSAATNCTACGVACAADAINSCSNGPHACTCGSNAACSGANDVCVGGSCVACDSDDDCTSATAPLCQGNACVACNNVAVTNADQRCQSERGGSGLCATHGTGAGRCAACDPGANLSDSSDDVGCVSQACNTTLYVCE